MKCCLHISVFYLLCLLLLKKNHIYSNWVIQLFLNRALEDTNSQGNRPGVLAAGRRCIKGSALAGRGAEKHTFKLHCSARFSCFLSPRPNISPSAANVRPSVRVEVQRPAVSTAQNGKHSISRAPAALLTVVILSGCQPELMGCLGSS